MRTLLFDIDGTLLLTNRGGAWAMKQSIEQEFGVVDPRIRINFSGRTDKSLMIEILQQLGLPDDLEHQARLRRIYESVLPGVLAQNGGRLMPGVNELLPRLAQHRAVRCYVMTGNLRLTAEHKLQHFGLLGYFRDIFGGDHDERREALAERTAAALRAKYGAEQLQQVVVIGDTPADIRCAQAIGAYAVAVCTGNYTREQLAAEQPQLVLEDLSAVDTVYELLTSLEFSR